MKKISIDIDDFDKRAHNRNDEFNEMNINLSSKSFKNNFRI